MFMKDDFYAIEDKQKQSHKISALRVCIISDENGFQIDKSMGSFENLIYLKFSIFLQNK